MSGGSTWLVSNEVQGEREIWVETQRLREEYKLYEAGTVSIKNGNVRQQFVIIAIIFLRNMWEEL